MRFCARTSSKVPRFAIHQAAGLALVTVQPFVASGGITLYRVAA
jgi:hypothetical protein